MPVDYQLAKIYKIEALNPDHESDVYIGSTCEPSLAHRMAGHRRTYKCWQKGNFGHMRSFDLFNKYGIDNCQILLIQEYPCETKDQLRKREGYYIKAIPCVNKYLPGRSNKEYYEHNRETILKSKQIKFKCICGGCYTRNDKSTHYKTKKHINYMTKHDDIMNTINDLLISINQLKSICSINYSNI